MSSSRLKRLEALRQRREAGAMPADPRQFTDAQLLKIAGLPPDATDEQIEKLAQSLEKQGRDHGAG